MHIFYKTIAAEMSPCETITLHDSDILFYGSNRVCYRYSGHPSKLIKTARNPAQWRRDHRQSLSEWYISKHLNHTSVHCPISYCRRWVMTNLGPGLVVDKIIDNSGHSITLRALLYTKELTVDDATRLVENVIKKFSQCGIPASDFNIDNFILEGNHHDHKLIMVDGFSPKKLNIKAFLLLKSRWLANAYTQRKWQKTKHKFIQCAQQVYEGDYRYAAARPLDNTPKTLSGGVSDN